MLIWNPRSLGASNSLAFSAGTIGFQFLSLHRERIQTRRPDQQLTNDMRNQREQPSSSRNVLLGFPENAHHGLVEGSRPGPTTLSLLEIATGVRDGALQSLRARTGGTLSATTYRQILDRPVLRYGIPCRSNEAGVAHLPDMPQEALSNTLLWQMITLDESDQLRRELWIEN